MTVTGTDLAGNTYAGSDSIEITLDATAPTVTLSDTDDDNFVSRIGYSNHYCFISMKAMTATPTISISGTSISNEVMTKMIGGSLGSPIQLGQMILMGKQQMTEVVASVSLSSDGTRVAIGANMGMTGPMEIQMIIEGSVRIYDWNGNGLDTTRPRY